MRAKGEPRLGAIVGSPVLPNVVASSRWVEEVQLLCRVCCFSRSEKKRIGKLIQTAVSGRLESNSQFPCKILALEVLQSWEDLHCNLHCKGAV